MCCWDHVGFAKECQDDAVEWRKALQMEADIQMIRSLRVAPGVTVEHVSVTSDYYNKLSVAIAAGCPRMWLSLCHLFAGRIAEPGYSALDKCIERAGIQPGEFFPLVGLGAMTAVSEPTADVDANNSRTELYSRVGWLFLRRSRSWMKLPA